MPDDITGSPQLSGVREYLASQGAQVPDGYSDADILGALHEGFRNPQVDPRLTQLAVAGREYSELQGSDDWKQYQTWRGEQQKKAPAPELPKGYEPPAWEVPDAVDESEVLMVDPQTGQPTINPNASYAAIQKYRNYQKWQSTQAQKMLREFPSLVRAYAKAEVEELKKTLPQQFDQRVTKHAREQQTWQYINQHAQDIFEFDQQGNTAVDPYTGQEKLQPLGQLLLFHANQARGMLGKRLDEDLSEAESVKVQAYAQQSAERDMALAYAPYYLAQQQQAQQQQSAAYGQPQRGPNGQFLPQQTPQQRNTARKETFEQRARRQREHNPGENTETPRQTTSSRGRRASFSQLAMEKAKEMGLAT